MGEAAIGVISAVCDQRITRIGIWKPYPTPSFWIGQVACL